MSDDLNVYNTTAPVVIYNPTLFKPQKYKDAKTGKEQGEPKFGAEIVMDANHPDLGPMKQMAARVAKEGLPGKPFAELVFPFKNGDKLADEAAARVAANVPKARLKDHLRGKVVLYARSQFAAKLSMLANGKVIDFADGEEAAPHQAKFFSGAEALVELKFASHAVGSNKPGVNVYLNRVLVTGKGTRLAGSAAPSSEVFRHYLGTVSAVDPTAGMDEEIPF